MQYYCDMIEKYDHALYVSGTNLPYGYTKYTHLSYQTINTLDFTEEQFDSLVEKHCNFIQEPISYLQGLAEIEEKDMVYHVPNWKKAVFENSDFVNDSYVHEQLENTKKGLLTKLATGKILVEGQTRYLCRDLLSLLSSLRINYKDINESSVELMTEILLVPSIGDEIDEKAFEQKFSRTEYALQHPFMYGGETKQYKIRVDRRYISRVVEDFSYEIKIMAEADENVDIRVSTSSKGMVYWLLKNYDIAELIDNKDEELDKELAQAVEQLNKKYGK